MLSLLKSAGIRSHSQPQRVCVREQRLSRPEAMSKLNIDTLKKGIATVQEGSKEKPRKFLTLVQHSDNLENKITEIRSQVKFQLKKVLCMGVAVGHVNMTPDEVRQNSLMAINFLVSLLKKNWNNVKRLHMKSTMGKPFTIYG